jgi:hypothetical protein
MTLMRLEYLPMLRAFEVSGSSLWISIVVGVIIMGLITTGNIIAIKRKIATLWRQKD